MVSMSQEQGNWTHSNPSVDGVSKALRFCVMLSSIEARDVRRKSNF
jgi:hypothetical protein